MTRYQAVKGAAKAFDKWLDDAALCRELFLAANMAVPEILDEVCGTNPVEDDHDAVATFPAGFVIPQNPKREQPVKRRDPNTLLVPPPPSPPTKPAGVQEDWVYLKAIEASPRNLTIAVLYQARETISAAKVSKIVNEARCTRATAAAYNSLDRLKREGDLEGDNSGYRLKNSELKGFIQDGWLWVPESLLTDQDRAAIRRRATELILLENGPLATADVTKVLARCTWLPTSITKDASKADLTAMELDGRVRRLEDKTWEVLQKD